MNDTKIASKTKARLAHFMGKVFTRFSKPAKKFIGSSQIWVEMPGTMGRRVSAPLCAVSK